MLQNILQDQKLETLYDLFFLMEEELIKELGQQKAVLVMSKIQTGLIRYTLPGWEESLKITKRLTPQQIARGIEFMKQISLLQADNALEVQAQVFENFGEQVTPASKRVYKSAVNKLLEFGRAQPNWPTRTRQSKGRAPSMTGSKAPLGPRYALKEAQFTPQLKAEIEHLAHFWANVRIVQLGSESIKTYSRGVKTLLGWLHRYKGVPLNELSLFKILPPEALTDPEQVEQVMATAKEYIKWLQEERQLKPSAVEPALATFFQLVEYVNYVQHTDFSNRS